MGRPKKKKKPHSKPWRCVVCGDPCFWGSQCCSDPDCQAIARLNPVLYRESKRKHEDPTRSVSTISRLNLARKRVVGSALDTIRNRVIRMLRADMEAGEVVARDCTIRLSSEESRILANPSDDVRGIDAPEAVKRNPWSWGSKVIVGLELRDDPREIGAALVVTRPKGVKVSDFIRKRLMGNSGFERAYDLFAIWRCSCPERKQAIYETIHDLPEEDGYHDYCPRCRYAPIEVRTATSDEEPQIETKGPRDGWW